MNALVPVGATPMMTIPEVERVKASRALERGHEKVASGCWEWRRATMNTGYGRIYTGFRRDMSAHRAAYLVWVGPIADGLVVMHRCDNRLCINPAHLMLGTKRDNSRDMVAKGRNISPPASRIMCPHGHAYDGTNSRGARICSICNRAARRRHHERSVA